MNIHHISKAVEELDAALISTIDSADRHDIECCNKRLRAVLRKHGVFIGGPSEVCRTTEGGYLEPHRGEAFIITPDPSGQRIRHQYGCAYCKQFETTGRIEPVSVGLNVKCAKLLSCDYASAEEFSKATGFEATDTDEGLATLKDGRFIITQNCD